MFSVTTKVVYNKIPQITAELEPHCRMVVSKTVFEIEADVKESMSGPKSGREYRRSGGRMHQASAPGEAPAIDYGALVNSIQSAFPGRLTGIVYTNMDYAPVLEYGGVKMAARPFMQPAADKAWPDFQAAMKAILGGVR